jgi:O-antigen ligase
MSSTLAPSAPKTLPARARQGFATDSFLLAGIFGLLFFAPLAFGATESWSVFVLEAGAILLFGLWVWRQANGDEWRLRNNPLFKPMALFAAVVLVQLVFGWTAYRHDTFLQTLLYAAYGLLAFLTIQTLRRSSQAKAVAVAITVYGVAVASFALLQGLSPNGKLYWIRTPLSGGWIYGPYVSHNNYAGLMEMLVPIPLVFCLTRYVQGHVRTAIAAGAALMAGTIFLSGSRGGMVSFVAEMILFAVVLIRMQKGTKVAAGVGIFAVVTVALLLWVGGMELSKRVSTIGTEAKQELSGGLRWTIDKDGIRMFAHKPVLGWGLGTFPVAYPQFRSFFTTFFINDAHNDYLQIAVETGAVGLVVILWLVIATYRGAFRKLVDWPDDINGAVALACLLGCTGILVHSFVDFNLQIPANAAWFYVICAVAASHDRLESRQRVRRSRSAHSRDAEIETQGPDELGSSQFTQAPKPS